MMEYVTAYLVLCCLYTLVWGGIFILRKDARRELLTVTAFGMPLGLTQVLHLDYWQPHYVFLVTAGLGLEDFLWAGIVFGVAATLYELVARRRTYRARRVRTGHLADVWLSLVVVTGVLTLSFATLALGIPSAHVATAGLLLLVCNIVVYRLDLFMDAFASGVLLVGCSFVIYVIWQTLYPGVFEAFWLADAFKWGSLAGVPLLELAYLFAIGAVVGPIYEVVEGLRLRRTPTHEQAQTHPTLF